MNRVVYSTLQLYELYIMFLLNKRYKNMYLQAYFKQLWYLSISNN